LHDSEREEERERGRERKTERKEERERERWSLITRGWMFLCARKRERVIKEVMKE
jgi:hypothetical protein